METISSCNSTLGDCNKDIELLREAFGSAFSLEAIASAYSQASRNMDMAGAILYDLQRQTSTLAPQSEDVLDKASLSSSNDASQSPSLENGDIANVVPSHVVSGATRGEQVEPTLSSKDVTSKQGSNGSFATSCSSNWKDDHRMDQEIEEFLFNMLGDGFQLDKKMISEVLGLCGYDLDKSMETLVDLSAKSLGKSDDVVSRTLDRDGSLSCPEGSPLPDSSLRSVNGEESSKKNKDKHDLQREILGSLFTAPARVQEQPKRIVPQRRAVGRSSAFGRPVVGPLKEAKIEGTFVTVKPLGAVQEGKGDEDSFVVLRQAVKEYWALMKEYYKAATEAYAKGDQERANKLMKEGQFYRKKAQEADEKSTQKVLETSCRDDELLINLSTFKPREAVEQLMRNLLIFAGMPTFSHLKLMVGNDDGEHKKGRRKRLVLKLLEEESIEWTEVDDGATIVIRLDKLNPKTLKFTKK